MVKERKAWITDRLEHRVAQLLAVVYLLGIGGLEQKTTQCHDLHEQPVSGLDRMPVDMPREWQVTASRRLTGSGFSVSG
jgi:hypothetical protein